MRPFFSVVIPTRNRPDFATRAVKAILNQSERDLEVIVLENSDPQARYEGSDDRRVRVVSALRVLPMPENWERLFGAVSGRYVVLLSDKDVLVRGALSFVRAA